MRGVCQDTPALAMVPARRRVLPLATLVVRLLMHIAVSVQRDLASILPLPLTALIALRMANGALAVTSVRIAEKRLLLELPTVSDAPHTAGNAYNALPVMGWIVTPALVLYAQLTLLNGVRGISHVLPAQQDQEEPPASSAISATVIVFSAKPDSVLTKRAVCVFLVNLVVELAVTRLESVHRVPLERSLMEWVALRVIPGLEGRDALHARSREDNVPTVPKASDWILSLELAISVTILLGVMGQFLVFLANY